MSLILLNTKIFLFAVTTMLALVNGSSNSTSTSYLRAGRSQAISSTAGNHNRELTCLDDQEWIAFESSGIVMRGSKDPSQCCSGNVYYHCQDGIAVCNKDWYCGKSKGILNEGKCLPADTPISGIKTTEFGGVTNPVLAGPSPYVPNNLYLYYDSPNGNPKDCCSGKVYVKEENCVLWIFSCTQNLYCDGN